MSSVEARGRRATSQSLSPPIAGSRTARLSWAARKMRTEISMSVKDFNSRAPGTADADPPYIELVIVGGWSNERVGGGFVEGVSERARREL